MAVEKNYARLGFFLLAVLVVAIATAMLFIQRFRDRAVFELVTYTTENVSGLDVSSPVKLKGVPVGRVVNVRVNPSTSTIQIDFDVFVDRLLTLGSNMDRIQEMMGSRTSQGFRTQLISNPVTGEAYLLLDMPAAPPPPMELGFTPDRTYIPSMPSMMATVRDRLPDVLEQAEATLDTLREIVMRIPGSLDRSDRFFTNIERIFQESELPTLSADSRKFFTTTSGQIDQMTAQMERLIGPDGTLVALVDDTRAAVKSADLPGSTQAARDAMDRTTLAADELRRSLPAIRESLQQLRELARLLESQPESVVYGQRPPEERPK